MGLILLAAVAIMHLTAFAAFGFDKRRARQNAWRVSEATLLTLAFLTGFIGAWWGMKVFRHKTQKGSFKRKLFLVTVFNLLWPLLWLWW